MPPTYVTHLLVIPPFHAGTQLTASTELKPCTPQHQVKQPAPSITSAEAKRYQRRMEEGIDIPAP